ncbi:MAG: dihydrofolate reductase [Clostridium sp.]|nr:dihydrofolate reductase [Clostridium sp.]
MLSILVAFSENYIIGKDGKLPWHLSNDLKRFKNLTTGNTIIMGRKTFESLPKVLPNRKHIVLTKNINYKIDDPNVTIERNLNNIIELSKSEIEYFLIGGDDIFSKLLPYCQKLYITKIHFHKEGDTYFPKLNINNYKLIFSEAHVDNGTFYDFLDYEKKQ